MPGGLIPFVQFIFSFSISCFAISNFIFLLYKLSKLRERYISVPILVNICAWLTTGFFGLSYSGSSIISWTEPEINSAFIFFSGGLYFSGTTAVSVSVFFLLLDRCLILMSPSWYTERVKRRFYVVNILFVIIDFFTLISIFIAYEMPVFKGTDCEVFSCVTKLHAKSLNVTRIIFGSINTILALNFAILFYRYNKSRATTMIQQQNNSPKDRHVSWAVSKINSSKVKSNLIAATAVLSQIVFNFLPNLAAFIALEGFGVALSSSAGPVVSTFTQIDALCTTLLYMKVVGERIFRAKTQRTNTIAPTTIYT